MRGLLITILLFIFQNVISKEISRVEFDTDVIPADSLQDVILNNFMVDEFKERGLTDIWNNIKNSAKNAWNNLKNFVGNTKEKIKSWVQNVKERAIAIAKSFEEHLNALKAKIKEIVTAIKEDDNIQKCLDDENEIINVILKNLVHQVTSCISNKISDLAPLENFQILDTVLNETMFMDKIDKRLDMCKQSRESIKDCLQNVRKDILKETEALEGEILRSGQTSRNLIDDILDAVITCSSEGLIQASTVIINEVLKVLDCIAQGQSANEFYT